MIFPFFLGGNWGIERLGKMPRATQLVVLKHESNSRLSPEPKLFNHSPLESPQGEEFVCSQWGHALPTWEEISSLKMTQKGRWRLGRATGGAVLGWDSQPDSEWSPRLKGSCFGSPAGGQHSYSSRSLSGKWTRGEVARGMEHERKNDYIYEVQDISRCTGMDVRKRCQPLGSSVTTMTSGANGKNRILNFPALTAVGCAPKI